MNRLQQEWQRLRTSSFVRNSGWALAGSGGSLVLQAGYFALLTRLLGVRDYGIFVGAMALATIVAPYCSLGTGMLFMRYVKPHPENYARYWGNILFTVTVNSALLVGILGLFSSHLIGASGASHLLVVLVGVSACFSTQLATAIGQVFQTYHQMRSMAVLQFIMNLLRFFTVVVLQLALHRATALQWAIGSCISTVAASLLAVIFVTRRFGRPDFEPKLAVRRAGEGFGFSLAGSMTTAYNDLDKAILSHTGMDVANGIYTAAYRVIDIASIPIFSIEIAAMPRFFAASTGGIQEIWSLARTLLIRIVPIGILIAGGVILVSPLVPRFFGPGFALSEHAVRYLALIPLFRGIHQIAGGALTGYGAQWRRTAAQGIAVALNLILNLLWIPRQGWVGAAWASVATDGALGLMTLALLLHLRLTAQTLVVEG